MDSTHIFDLLPSLIRILDFSLLVRIIFFSYLDCYFICFMVVFMASASTIEISNGTNTHPCFTPNFDENSLDFRWLFLLYLFYSLLLLLPLLFYLLFSFYMSSFLTLSKALSKSIKQLCIFSHLRILSQICFFLFLIRIACLLRVLFVIFLTLASNIFVLNDG